MCKWMGLLSVLMVFAGTGTASFAGVEWETEYRFELDQPPLDVAVTPDGKHLFVLTKKGISVYSQDGKLVDKINVGYAVDRIRIGPRGRRLFITSRKNRTVEALDIAFIFDIDLSGSPYKGPRNAPVVIAVFSDFQ